MRAVNLLPSDAYTTRRWWSGWLGGDDDLGPIKQVATGVGAAALFVAVLLGVFYVHEKNVVHSRQNQLAALNDKVAIADASLAKARAAQATAQSQLATFTTLTSQRVVWEKILRDLAHVLPRNVWLSSMTAAAPVAVAPTPVDSSSSTDSSSTDSSSTDSSSTDSSSTDSGTSEPAAPVAPPVLAPTFTVVGTTGSQRDVAFTLDRLALLPWLSNVTLQTSTGATGTPGVQFTIGASLSSTGGK
jgi:Tfp pilus assembly protein PilN